MIFIHTGYGPKMAGIQVTFNGESSGAAMILEAE
jgi:hypothetical protein